MTPLCPSCRALYERWIDYRWTGPLGRWRTDPPGPDHADLYWQRSLEMLRKARGERESLVDQQCAAIKEICATKHRFEGAAA